jgi:uncharacterized membrane protein
MPVETLAQGEDSRLVEPRRFLIRDRQSFNAVWAAHAGPDAPAPVVDFDERMVAAVFAGERPTPGFAVEVTGTRREGQDLVVLVAERRPDPALVAAQIIVSPFHIATLPRDDGAIRFDLPDPDGTQTIVFKAPPRKASGGVRAASFPVAGPGSTIGDAERGEVSVYTGLRPPVAATLAYLAGPFSGALLLAAEPASHFVRFHAWQAVLGLGVLGVSALAFLVLAFLLLVVSPMAFWAMLWIAAATAAAWVAMWVLCVVNAYRGRVLRLPLAGYYAERML